MSWIDQQTVQIKIRLKIYGKRWQTKWQICILAA